MESKSRESVLRGNGSEASLTGKEIAVIGMAGRFPGARTIDEFWQNLKNGVESVYFFQDKELEKAGADPQIIKLPNYVKAKGVLENKEYFDAGFFGYTPLEAEIMNPQVRIFHECAWEAMENAGYDPGSYNGSIGLYAGAGSSSYWEAIAHMSGKSAEIGEFAAGHLNNKDFINARISYNLNLNGPVFFIYTACSTSLVAIHLACRSLLMGECKMALAGGITINTSPEQGYLYQPGMVTSPDGHCRAFDAKSGGFIGGEGGGLVLLKHLKKAISDGDYIYAVVKGSAINNDGNQKVGFTAPSLKFQAEVIQTALRIARVEPGTISYIETHGTGTTLGDPIEIRALTLVFNKVKRRFCAIGSVKTNIGHLDTGAGVAGFIKTVLALKHRLIPPSLHFQSPNPGIDFESSPFYVNTELKQWSKNGLPLRAGVTSLGIGGTNAHVILEEAPGFRRQTAGDRQQESPQLIVLSARTGIALNKVTENVVNFFKGNPGVNLSDVAYTLQVGRSDFKHRRIEVCSSVNKTIKVLSSPHSEKKYHFVSQKDKKNVVFMFPGQGSQYINMGLDLYKTEPLFRQEMDHCREILRPLLGFDINEILYPGECDTQRGIGKEKNCTGTPSPKTIPINRSHASGADCHKFDQTEIVQPLLFSIEYALARLLLNWEIIPRGMIGHSIGEYVAACLAGVFSLEDALSLVTARGKLMQQIPPGAMLSISISEEQLLSLLKVKKDIALAAVNSTSRCVLSGSRDAIDVVENQLKSEGYETKRLHTSHAFHSPMMEPVLEKFKKEVKKIRLNKPGMPYISNLTGNWVTTAEVMDPDYWSLHLRKTVRFADGIGNLLKKEHVMFIEIGPGKTLSTLVRQHADKTKQQEVINILRHPGESIPDTHYLLNQVGKLWLYGIDLNWEKFSKGEKKYRIPLPTYPFEGSRYWYERDLFKTGLQKKSEISSPVKKPDIGDWFYVPLWEQGIPEPLCFPGSLTWLVFINEQEFAANLVDHLVRNGQHVVKVKAGTKFTSNIKSDGTCTINPHKPADYDSLFRELRQLNLIPGKILHLWNITGEDTQKQGLEELDNVQDLGLFSLLNIVQTTGRLDITCDVQVEVLTDNMQRVTGEECLSPEKSTVLGAIKVIPLEYPNIKCRSIDIVLPRPGSRREGKLLNHLLGEITANSKDKFVVYRGDQRWTRVYKSCRIEEKPAARQLFRERGVYLIIGGFGGMGFTIAEYLAKTFSARLILVGRSFLTSRKEWGQWLKTHGPEDETAIKIKKILEWEELGAEIMAVGADVSNPEQMQEAISRVNHKFHQVNGVIHAAGVVDYGGAIQKRTREVTGKYMASKLRGTLILEKLFKEAKLDFLVLFSSIGNVIYKGKFGQVSYNAANEFLEAFSDYKFSRDDCFTVTINWNDWKEVGMSVRTLEKLYAGKDENLDLDTMLDDALSPPEGVEVFKRVMESQRHRITVSTKDLFASLQKQEKDLEKALGETILEDIKKKRDTAEDYLYQRSELSTPYAAPRTRVETALVEIFQRLSQIEHVGIHDDFFELGGDSLKAMTVIANIHKTLQASVPLAVFFNNPTIEEIARYIDNTDKYKFNPIKPIEEKEYYQLSSAQKRLYFIQKIDSEGKAYNMYTDILIETPIDIDRVEETFRKLIKRHEGFRTSFELVEGKVVQRIHDNVEFQLEYSEVKSSGCDEAAYSSSEVEDRIKNFIRPFHLDKAPLLRVEVIKIEENKSILVLNMHHIVSDGTSMGIFTRDFLDLYQGIELSTLKLRYRDFSEWQNRLLESEKIKKQEEHWLDGFKDKPPDMNLPTDFSQPPVINFEGEVVKFDLGKEMSLKVDKHVKETDTTLFMVLLSVYFILLSKYTGLEDIVIGTKITGRTHPDLQQTIGMFVNMLALRNRPQKNKIYKEFLGEVKENALNAYENQDYPFQELVKKLGFRRKLGKNPLFDTVFALKNMDLVEINSDNNMKVTPYKSLQEPTNFDMQLEGIMSNGTIIMELGYSTNLFKPSTARKIARRYVEILEQVVENINIKIGDITISHDLFSVTSNLQWNETADFKF